MRSIALFSVALGMHLWAGAAQAKLEPAEVPAFQIRAKISSLGGQDPGDKKFAVRLDSGSANAAAGKTWSDWLKYERSQVEQTLKGYPAMYMQGYPVVVRLSVAGVVDPTAIEAELKFDGSDAAVPMSAELLGPSLGILIWRDADKKPRAATMADYNKRYWKVLEQVQVPAERRPKKFPIVDRFIGGDDDRRAWQQGIEQLNRAGFSAIMLPPSAKIRDMLLKAGQHRTAWAVYNPPGYAFDHDAKITDQSITEWANQQAKPYFEAGYAREDMAAFAMSDEPGWYYPQAFGPLKANPAALARFRDYIKAQGLSPADVDAKSWDDVLPIGRSQAKTLPSRRLFYWTMRFFPYDSARHFAKSTAALEQAFYPGVPVLTNWNFFAGRFYVPGPAANNPDKTSPDAAMGGHDWLEFGRMRGGTMLWTEDWFGDGQAYQWSFYAARLRCAAEKGGVQFGGYVIPRTAGDREDGILQKILCVVGSGGKAIKYFVFGPEYNFPGNCYSERAEVMPKMAEAHAMIGAAEELLWPGKRPRPQVAILAPRSAQAWDAKNIPIPTQISDATNNNLNGATVDYMAEVFDLYLALQHANIPVDFIEEDDLTPAGLKPYRAVYVTAPNIPVEGQQGLVDWVKAGGTLVTTSGAAQRDRYDEPCSVLGDAAGMREKPREPLLVANTKALADSGHGQGTYGEFTAVGPRGGMEPGEGVQAKFDDGSPAIAEHAVGQGRMVHFAWMPGLSYWKSSKSVSDKLPVGFSDSIRRWITAPCELAGVQPPVTVDRPLVETPVLLSEAGAAITLLNWTGAPIKELKLSMHLAFKVRLVKSVKHGELPFVPVADGIQLTTPLDAADVLMLYK